MVEISKPKKVEAEWEFPKPQKEWPSEGIIEVKNINFKYRPELELVLKNVSFSVKKGEKVGIIGRTGSGKSSLI